MIEKILTEAKKYRSPLAQVEIEIPVTQIPRDIPSIQKNTIVAANDLKYFDTPIINTAMNNVVSINKNIGSKPQNTAEKTFISRFGNIAKVITLANANLRNSENQKNTGFILEQQLTRANAMGEAMQLASTVETETKNLPVLQKGMQEL